MPLNFVCVCVFLFCSWQFYEFDDFYTVTTHASLTDFYVSAVYNLPYVS